MVWDDVLSPSSLWFRDDYLWYTVSASCLAPVFEGARATVALFGSHPESPALML